MVEIYSFDKRAEALILDGQGEPNELLTTQQLAKWFSVSTVWVENGRTQGYGPPPTYLSPRCVRYHRQVVLDWLDERVLITVAGGVENL